MISLDSDPFNLRPLTYLTQAGVLPIPTPEPIKQTGRPITRTITCSFCGRERKLRVDFDVFKSSSNLQHFCQSTCAAQFRMSDLDLLTPAAMSEIHVRFTQLAEDPTTIASDLNLSLAAVRQITLRLYAQLPPGRVMSRNKAILIDQ